MMNTQNKNELRQKYRALRDNFGEEFIKKASDGACENIAKIEFFIKADTVLLYYPIKNEISPLPLFELCLKMGKTVGFPVCQSENSTIIFKKANTLDNLSPQSFGLFEPNDDCEIIIPTKNTLCLVPALLFSRDGHRLGYGKGYYDRFLNSFEGISAGLSYSMLLCDTLPHETHDIPLDMIITESEVLNFAKKN